MLTSVGSIEDYVFQQELYSVNGRLASTNISFVEVNWSIQQAKYYAWKILSVNKGFALQPREYGISWLIQHFFRQGVVVKCKALNTWDYGH